jgi:hypothetical protein
MEAGSHSGIARLVQQSLGTSALFPSCVFVVIRAVGIYVRSKIYLSIYLCVRHRSKKCKLSPCRVAAATPRPENLIRECSYLPIWAARSKESRRVAFA